MKSTDIKNHKTSISQTHNLEVPGFFPTVRGSSFDQQISSSGWSTLLLQRLTSNRRPLFFFFHKTYPTEKKRATGAFATKLQKPFRNFATEIEKGTECSWLYRTKSIAKLWKK